MPRVTGSSQPSKFIRQRVLLIPHTQSPSSPSVCCSCQLWVSRTFHLTSSPGSTISSILFTRSLPALHSICPHTTLRSAASHHRVTSWHTQQLSAPSGPSSLAFPISSHPGATCFLPHFSSSSATVPSAQATLIAQGSLPHLFAKGQSADSGWLPESSASGLFSTQNKDVRGWPLHIISIVL